jgi:Outer membrane protein Omp28.
MYKGKKSENTVEIVADKVGPTELPEDSAPENFKFKRSTVAFFYTGVWCPNCPLSIRSIKDIEHQEAYEGIKKQVAFVEIHGPDTGRDPYTIPAGMELATSAKVSTYPNFSFNLERRSTGGLLTSALAQNIKNYNEVEAKVGISAVVIKESLKLKVKIGLKANAAGEYGVGAFLVEDGIYHNQSNGVVYGSQYDFNEHDNILRAASSAKDFFGDKVSIEANKTANHEISFTNLNDGWKLPNCKVVIYVTDSATKLINNAVICHVGEQVGFQY